MTSVDGVAAAGVVSSSVVVAVRPAGHVTAWDSAAKTFGHSWQKQLTNAEPTQKNPDALKYACISRMRDEKNKL